MGRIRSSNEKPGPAYQVDTEIEAVLNNWGRWAAVRSGRSVRTSVLFVSLKARDEDTYAQSTPVPIDPETAWRAEKVICHPGFVPRWRHLLTADYVFQQDMRNTCRLLGLHQREYDAELWHASYGFWNRYQRA